MSSFKIVASMDKVKLSPKWKEAARFDCKGDVVDKSGRTVDPSVYQGRCYRLISKKERNLFYIERLARRVVASILILFTFGALWNAKIVRKFLNGTKINQKFAVPYVSLSNSLDTISQQKTIINIGNIETVVQPAPTLPISQQGSNLAILSKPEEQKVLTQPIVIPSILPLETTPLEATIEVKPAISSNTNGIVPPEKTNEHLSLPKTSDKDLNQPPPKDDPGAPKLGTEISNETLSRIKKLKELMDAKKHKTQEAYLQPSSADVVGNYLERFELSLEPGKPNFSLQDWTGLFDAPHVGVYGNGELPFKAGDIEYNFYQWSPQIAMIRLPNAAIWDVIPQSMKKALEEKGRNEASMSNTEAVRCNFIISGNPFYQTGPQGLTVQSPKGYNISFHSTLLPKDSKGGKLKPLVGVFNPHNINSVDIPVNDFEERELHLHDDDSHACSPDNIRYEATGPIAQFWSLALVENQTAITFHIMLNDDMLETKVRAVSANSKNLAELLVGLKSSGIAQETVDAISGIFG